MVNDLFHSRGVEEVAHAVVVGGSGDDHDVGVAVGVVGIGGGREVERLFAEVLFYIVVLDRGEAAVDEVNPFWLNVNGSYLVMLSQEGGNAETDISGTGYCDLFHC